MGGHSTESAVPTNTAEEDNQDPVLLTGAELASSHTAESSKDIVDSRNELNTEQERDRRDTDASGRGSTDEAACDNNESSRNNSNNEGSPELFMPQHGYITSVDTYLQELKEFCSDSFDEEHLTTLLQSMFTIDDSKRTLVIAYEKSQDDAFSNDHLRMRTETMHNLRSSDADSEDNAHIEPFALQCLHLFDGNWTVLKASTAAAFSKSIPPGIVAKRVGRTAAAAADRECKNGDTRDSKSAETANAIPEDQPLKRRASKRWSFRRRSTTLATAMATQTVSTSSATTPHTPSSPRQKRRSTQKELEYSVLKSTTPDPRRLLAYSNLEYEPKTSRSFIHPLSFIGENQLNIFTSVLNLRLDAGNLEPLYCSLELFNGRTGQQLSERFHFHVNSYSIINDFLDDFHIKKQLLNYHKETPIPHAIFTLSNYSNGAISSSSGGQNGQDTGSPLISAAAVAAAMSAGAGSEEDNLSDVYILLRVEKTLQGEPIESIIKNYYSAPTNGDSPAALQSAIESRCSGLKQYRQPFLIAFAPLFQSESPSPLENSLPVCPDYGQERQGGGNSSHTWRNSLRAPDPIERSRRSSNRISRRASTTMKHLSAMFTSVGSEPNMSRKLGAMKLRTDLLPLKHMYSVEDTENVIDLIRREGCRDGTLKRQRQVGGYCLLKVSEFDPVAFEADARLRRELAGRRKSTNQSFSLEQAIESANRQLTEPTNEDKHHGDTPFGDIEQWHDAVNLDDSTPVSESTTGTTGARKSQSSTASDDIGSKHYLKFHRHEFTARVSKSPFFTFTHQLYLYPGAVNFANARPLGQSKIKPRNILCEVVFKQSSTETSSRLVQRYTNSLVDTYSCAVTYMNKTPSFSDEICVMLPLPILPTHHLLFNFYHLHIDKNVSKRRKDLEDGQSVKRTLLGHCVLPLSHTIDPQQNTVYLPIYQNLPTNYLENQDEVSTYDTKKNLFRCHTRLESTIYPKERALSRFFRDCSPFLNAVDPKRREDASFVSRATESAISALKELQTSVEPSKLVSHFPLVMDMVLSIMCRSPDILNTFINTKEQEQRSDRFRISGMRSGGRRSAGNRGSTIFDGRQRDSIPRSTIELTTSQEDHKESEEHSAGSTEAPSRRIRSSIRQRHIPTLSLGDRQSILANTTDFSVSNSQSKSSRRQSGIAAVNTTTDQAPDGVAKPGDANFNLFEFLQAQQQQQQQGSDSSSGSSSERRSLSGANTNRRSRRRSGTAEPGSVSPGSQRSGRRLSLFHTVSNKLRNRQSRSSDQEAPELLSLSQSTLKSHDSFVTGVSGVSDLSDFFGISSKLFDLQREAFKTLIHLINSASFLHMDSSRNNPLLSSYVGFIFKDIVLTTSPLCFVLAEQWSDVLTSGSVLDRRRERTSNQLRRSRSGKRLSKERRRTRGLSPESPLVSEWGIEFGSGTDILSAAPLHYQSLSCAWFFFDIMVKSFLLTGGSSSGSNSDNGISRSGRESDVSEGDEVDLTNVYQRSIFRGSECNDSDREKMSLRFANVLRELVSSIADRLGELKDDSANESLAQSLNQACAIFFRDLLATRMKVEHVLQVIEHYLAHLCRGSMCTATLKLLVDFILVMSDDPNFVALNNAAYMPHDEHNPKEQQHEDTRVVQLSHKNIFTPPIRMLISTIAHMFKFTRRREPELLAQASDCVGSILSRFDLDVRYQQVPEQQRPFVARVFFPYAEFILANVASYLLIVEEGKMDSHCKSVMWILLNVDEQFLLQTVMSNSDMCLSILEFIALVTELLSMKLLKQTQTAKLRTSGESREEYEQLFMRAAISGIQRLFSLLCRCASVRQALSAEMNSVGREVEPPVTDINQSGPLACHGNGEDDKSSVRSWIHLCVFTLTQLVRCISECQVPVVDEFSNAMTYVMSDVLCDGFRQHQQSTYFKWLYAALISGDRSSSLVNGSADSDTAATALFKQLIQIMENCVAADNVVSDGCLCVDNIDPIEIDSDGHDLELDERNPNQIKASSLDRLIVQVTSQHQSDPKLQEIFFLTYRSFCTPMQLLQKFIARFMHIAQCESVPRASNKDEQHDENDSDSEDRHVKDQDNVVPTDSDCSESDSVAMAVSDEVCDDGANSDESPRRPTVEIVGLNDGIDNDDVEEEEEDDDDDDNVHPTERLMATPSQQPANDEQLAGGDDAIFKVLVLRVINALRFWISEHFYDFEHNAMVVLLFRFVSQKLSGSYRVPENAVKLLINRFEQNLLGMMSSSSTIGHPSRTAPSPHASERPILPQVSIGENMNIVDWHPLEVARQLTLIEWDMFRRVRPKELLMLGWTTRNRDVNSPNIVALTMRFNQLSAWICTEIVRTDDVTERAQLVKHFIHIADACVHELNNLNAANSIISALNNASIHRLKRTWEMVEKISKKDNTMTIFHKLCDLFSINSSFAAIRAHMEKNTIGRACVPYIGIYLTDLVFIEEGNSDKRVVNGRELINFNKRRQIAKVIMTIRRFQQSGVYRFESVSLLRDYLVDITRTALDDDAVYKLSLKVEPRQQQQQQQ